MRGYVWMEILSTVNPQVRGSNPRRGAKQNKGLCSAQPFFLARFRLRGTLVAHSRAKILNKRQQFAASNLPRNHYSLVDK